MPSSWVVPPHYNSIPNNSDSVGYLHNELVKHLTSNAVLDGNGTIDYSQFNSASVDFLTNRGYDSVTHYIPYADYHSIASPLSSLNSLNVIKSYLSTTYDATNAPEVTLWSNLCDSLALLAATNPSQSDIISLIATFEAGVSSMNISNERNEALRIGLRSARWSCVLWKNNVY